VSNSEAASISARSPRIRSYLSALPILQTAIYAGSNILVSALAVISTSLLARNLGATDFGRYAFAISLMTFTVMFFEFGIALPAARLAAIASDEREGRSVIGASIIAFVPIGLSYSLTLFGLSFVTDSVFHAHIGDALRIVAPLAFFYPFMGMALQLAQGVDRLHISSVTSALSQAIFVVFVVIGVTVTSTLAISAALALRMLAFMIGGFVFVIWIRPVFREIRRYVRLLLREVRAYGFAVYIGRVLTDATYNMDVLMLAAFANARSVGFYTIAGAIAYASGLPVMGMATALFARMTKRARLDRRWLVAAWGVGIPVAIITWALAEPFLRIVFSPAFAAASALVLPLALAQMIRGVTTVYNGFLSAHARGRELRNAAVVLTASNIVFNFALIPPFGASGAAWASFLALGCNYFAHVIYYRQTVGSEARPAVA